MKSRHMLRHNIEVWMELGLSLLRLEVYIQILPFGISEWADSCELFSICANLYKHCTI